MAQLHVRPGLSHFLTLPDNLCCRRLTAGDDGFLYALCYDAARGAETSLKISIADNGGHIEQLVEAP